jgi:putative ATP-dependent endonuclease of OLD family
MGESALCLKLNKGLTVLVGENDSGKTAIIDSIRYALLTRDQEYIRVQPEDFHIATSGVQASEISIQCKFEGLTTQEQGAFAEYLTYDGSSVALYLNWMAYRIENDNFRRWVDITVRSGLDASGPTFEAGARELLKATYLRPLRDAEREMSPGRGSRLSQILSNTSAIKTGVPFDKDAPPPIEELSLVGLADVFSHHVRGHSGISNAQNKLNIEFLSKLSLHGDDLLGVVSLIESGNDDARLRQILEKLKMNLQDASTGSERGNYGLGSNNLLFMACELLLLESEKEGLPLLLIEEPEAHLHPQRQLQLMDFLQSASERQAHPVQTIVTTHSPNLASKVKLNNLSFIQSGSAFPLSEEHTKLDKSDYQFLERFLDVTKANLFFARGVLVVEGDAEAILLPTLAKLIGKDLTKHGCSIVNVGGVGLCRYSKIFQRNNDSDPTINVPVACITDMDVMPDCAPQMLGLVTGDDDPKWTDSNRRWRSEKDFDADGLRERRNKRSGNDGQQVKTFVSGEWTLEYDLAINGLGKYVYIAASLALNDDPINDDRKTITEVGTAAEAEFAALSGSNKEIATKTYELFKTKRASKAIAAQYLANILDAKGAVENFDANSFKEQLPPYIVEAIEYVTGGNPVSDNNETETDA